MTDTDYEAWKLQMFADDSECYELKSRRDITILQLYIVGVYSGS